MVAKIFLWYSRQVKTRPFVTHSITYTGVFGFSEYIQLRSAHQPVQVRKIAHNAIFGGICQGPIITGWFLKIDKKYPAINATSIIKKVLLTQFIMTPVLSTLYILWKTYMEDTGELFETLFDKFPVAYFGGIGFWTPIVVINFLLIPPLYRVTFNLCAAFIWTNVLCFIGNYKDQFQITEYLKKITKL